MVSIKMDAIADASRENCRALSSDEDSFNEAERDQAQRPGERNGLFFSVDLHSSGYSSAQSVSPMSSSCSSAASSLVPCSLKTFTASPNKSTSADSQPGFRLLVAMQRPRGHSNKQVKRKNSAAHSGGEVGREEEEEEEEEENEYYSANMGFRIL